MQKDVAKFVAIGMETIFHWELKQTEVRVAHYPRIMEYLRYCPVPERAGIPTLGEQVRIHRIHRGLTLREAATVVGVDPGALSKWEQGTAKPMAASLAKHARFVRASREGSH